jgi:mRNA interferase HigB
MKVNLIKRQTVFTFINHHSKGKRSFESWLTAIKYANWDKPEDMKRTFRTIDLLGNGTDRVVFNVGGNKYRVIAKYYFSDVKVHLFIKWVGTHEDYDKLCAHNKQYSVDDY